MEKIVHGFIRAHDCSSYCRRCFCKAENRRIPGIIDNWHIIYRQEFRSTRQKICTHNHSPQYQNHILRPDDDLFGAGLGGLASSRSDGNLGGGGGGHLSYEMGELTGTVNSEHKAALVGRAEPPLSR